MRALSIRQPYAELILRGIKTAELRSRPTMIVGERFYIYASRGKLRAPALHQGAVAGANPQNQKVGIWSQDVGVGTPPAWMIELAEQVKMIEPGADLPRGVI